jgi:hypothetical protein
MRSAHFCEVSPVSAGNKTHPRKSKKICVIRVPKISATNARMMRSGNHHSCIRGRFLWFSEAPGHE